MRTSRYLWISNLPPDVTEDEIRESLISHGKIHNVKIHEVADSKGAVVAFFDQTGATKAIESANKLDGVILKIEYCDLHGSPGLQRIQQQQNQLAQQNCEKNPEWVDERGSRAKSPVDSHRNRSRSSSLSSTRSGRSNLTDVSKHGSSSRRERNYHKSVDHVRRKFDKGDRERDHDENSQESGGDSPLSRFGEMRGLKIFQLPQRSSDSNIKEGLFHELKRFGKITSVEIKGDDPSNRYAVVTFKRAEDAEKAYMKWNDKIYFFTNVIVERHSGTDKEDPSFCQPEQVLNEFHPKSTKTLFVGNLHHEPDSPKAKQELVDTFEEFGSILEIDIKKQPNQSGVAYAFIQYADINSVVRALHKAESIKIGGKPVKLGFGKSQPTQCLWLSNLPSGTTDGFLANHFKRYGPVKYIKLHPQQLRALVYFENVDSAQKALSEQKNRIIAGRKLQADYASQRCQRHLLDQILQLNSFHMRSHPIADALRLAYSHAYMKSTTSYYHYMRNLARYDERSRSRHMEDIDLYDPYVEAGRRGSSISDYEAFSQRRSGGSGAVGSSVSSYPDNVFGIESGNSRSNVSGGSSSVKKCSERNCVKTNGPSSETHYSRNRSDSPFSSKSSHSRDLRSRSRSPRLDRKHRESTNRSHNRSDSSHSGEGDASADSNCQRVMRHRRSTPRGSHSLSVSVGSDNTATRSTVQPNSCVRREHRGTSSNSTSSRTTRIQQRLKSEVKPAVSGSSNRQSSRRMDNASDDEAESDVEAPHVTATATSTSVIPSGHSATGDSSSIHSGGSGGHRSDDATDIGELMAQREKLLREIFEMDGDTSSGISSTINSSRTNVGDNNRSKAILRELVDSSHLEKVKSREAQLPPDSRKSKESYEDEQPKNQIMIGQKQEHDSRDVTTKRRLTDCAIPSRLSNGPLSKLVPGIVSSHSTGLPSDTCRSPGKSKVDDGAHKLTNPSKVEDKGLSVETSVSSTPLTSGPATNPHHKLHSQSYDEKFHSNQRTQHSVKSDQCSSNDSLSSHTSDRKLVTSSVTSCVNASRDPRLAPQQYGNRIIGANIPPHLKHLSPKSPAPAPGSSFHESSTEQRLTDLLQRFVQPVTAMAPTIAGKMEVNSSQMSTSNDGCSPPPPPPPLPHHGVVPPQVIDPQHSLPKGSTSNKQTVYHDDSSTLADCEDPELKSVMQKTSTIDKQIEELDMKISRSEIARATAPTIDRSKYRIRPRSDSGKVAITVVKPPGGPSTASESPLFSSTVTSDEKPPWKEESSSSNIPEFCETSVSTPSIKSQDTSEFVKSMLMQSSRTNSSFFISNSSASSNSGTIVTSTVSTPTPSFSSPPVSVSPTTNTGTSCSWTSPSLEDAHRSVTVSSTSNSVANRLNSPPIVSSYGASNVSNVAVLNKVQSSSYVTPSMTHAVTNVCVVSSLGTSSVTTISSPVTVVSSTPNNRPRFPSVPCCSDNNSDIPITPSVSEDTVIREPRSPEHLKSILKKEVPDTKCSQVHTSPTTPKSSLPDNFSMSVKNSHSFPILNVSSSGVGQKSQRSPTGTTTKTTVTGNDSRSVMGQNMKRKHSDEMKKPVKILKLEHESESKLFRPDAFLFANKSDVKKEKRSVDQVKRPLQVTTASDVFTDIRTEISPSVDLKSSPQLSNSSHEEFKFRRDETEEKHQRKFSFDENGKKRKNKDKSIESSDTGSKPDDSDDENKHESSKRKRKKKLNRSKEDDQRSNKKGKRKKKKKLDQNQMLKKKTHDKSKEGEDKVKKVKPRKQRIEGKESFDLSDSLERQIKKEKKEKADRKCSNDDSFSDDDWTKTVGFKDEGFITMYDFVKTKRKAESAKNQSHHKDHKSESKSSRRKSTENFKKSNNIFDSADNSIDESESRASSSKSVSRKSKGKSSKNKRRRQILSNYTSDDSDERDDNSGLMNKVTKSGCRFRVNSDEADDETDCEEMRKVSGKTGKKKPEKRKVVDVQLVSTKKSKKPKVLSDGKKKVYTEEGLLKKRRKKSSLSNNKLDSNDPGKQKMSVASVFSDVDTDSSTGTECRIRYPVKITPNEESDESQGSEDGLLLTPPKNRLVREQTAASSPTTPSTEPMSDDAVMNDLPLTGLPPFREKHKNPLKEALTSAHEESRKELKELQRESNLIADRHRAIADDEDVEVSEDLPSLEVMISIVKSPSFIDDEPPPITCDDAPTLTTDAEGDDSTSIVEETVIVDHCVDVPIIDDASDKFQSSIEESYCASAVTSRTSSSDDQMGNTDNSKLIESMHISVDSGSSKICDDSPASCTYDLSRMDVSQQNTSDTESEQVLNNQKPDEIDDKCKEIDIKREPIREVKTEVTDDACTNELKQTDEWSKVSLFSTPVSPKTETDSVSNSNTDAISKLTSSATPKPLAIATVFSAEQPKVVPADKSSCDSLVKSQGTNELSKSEHEENTDIAKNTNDTGNKVEMVRYVQRIMERVSVDISEDNKGSGKRIKKGTSGLSCPAGSSHPNQNILSSIADRGLSDRKPITTTNPACLLPPGCNIYLEDSKMLPNLPASVTLTGPVINPQPPLSVCGQTSQNSTPVTVISPILKNVTPMTTNATANRVNNQKSVTGSQINSPLTTSKSATIVDMSRASNQVGHDAQSIQFANQTSSLLASSSNVSDGMGPGKVNSLNSVNDSNSSILGPYSTRRVFTRRKRNSSSNTKSENEREGSWHAHVDEVLEKVVHGKSNTSNTELSKSIQPVNHLAIKLEDQIMQQKETDEAVRAIEISMTQVGSSDSSDIINSDMSSLKKDVDPYEPNFDEPSPSEINRNILTHSHHKRQDGNSMLPTETEEIRANTPTVRPAFEGSLNDVSDKPSAPSTAGTTLKSTLSVDVHGTESDKPRDEQVSPVNDESEDKTDTGKDKIPGVEKDANVEENRMVPKVHNIPKLEVENVNIPDAPLELKSEIKDKESDVSLVKPETSRTEDLSVGTVTVKKEMLESIKSNDIELQKLEQHKTPQIKVQVPAVQIQHPPVQQAIPQLQVTQLNLQKQQLNSMTAQTCQSQSQSDSHPLQQSIFIQSQQPVQAHLQPQTQALQLHQLQQLQTLQQQQLKFPQLLQQKSAASNAKHTENILENMSYRLIPSSKVNEVLTSVSETSTTSEATLSKEGLAPVTSIAAGNTGTRKRTNRAMSQTALIHVEEILDAVAHDKNFDLTQYSKDSSISRRRSNSGEDHFPQSNVMQQPMKDNPGMFATTDLRVLTPRSANAMVTCKVGAEEQIQVQATLTSQPASVSSVTSKVSIAPHMLEQFLKQTNTAISSQQFQQARPASAVGVNDANNMNNASLIAAVEPGFQKMALATSFASLSPGASISPALASTGLGNKTIAALATPIQPIETTKIVHPTVTSTNARHNLQQSAVTPTSQTSSIPSTCNQPYSVAQATATVEDRGHAIERIPNPGLSAVQHHRDQISPRLATASSASPAATNVSMDSKSNSLLNPVTGIVNSAASRPASNPVHLQSNTLSDSAQTSHQGRNFLTSGIAFEHNYDFQMQIAAMQQLMRQNTSHFNADGNLIDLISMHYLTMQSPNSAAQHQFWPPSGDQRRDSHNSVANTIIAGVPVQGLSASSLAAKPNTTPDWSPEQLQLLQSKYHMSWKGKLALKNDEVLVQMLFITGNVVLVKNCIRMIAGSLGGSGVPPLQHALKIVQRMRMEQSQLEGVVRKMEEDHCMLLAVPAGEDIPELETQANILNNSFIKYLQEKSAAGIINVNHNESQQPAYVVHIFPPGEFSRQRLSSCSIEPINTCGELPHLLVIITTV